MAVAPAANVGTVSILDTLAASNQAVASYGLDEAFRQIDLALQAHNRNMRDMRAAFFADTTDRLRRGGSYSSMKMYQLGEFGTPPPQKQTPGAPLGVPLQRWGGALQWSKLSLKRMSTTEMASQAKSMLDADYTTFLTNMQAAFFRPTNYTDVDKFVDNLQAIPLPVKALQNADGFPIPTGPNGEYFDPATHTHYLVCATPGTLIAADLDALLNTVREHYGQGQGYLAVTAVDGATVSGFTKFRAVLDARIVQATTSTFVNPAVATLDVNNTNNRMIGIYDGFEVWVKPWAVASFPVAWWAGAGVDKPLLFRHDPLLPSDLTLSYEGETHNLRADAYDRYYGLAAWNRIGMAVLDTLHGSYTSPV